MLPLIGKRYRNLLILLAVMWPLLGADCESGSLHEGDSQEIFPPDPCFNGLFVSRRDETEVLFEVAHTEVIDETPEPWTTVTIVNGLVTALAWEISAEPTEPWDNLTFNGEVRAIGEAQGYWTVDYPESDPDYEDKTTRRLTLALRDDFDSGCPDLLDVYVSYQIDTDWRGDPVYETYDCTAHRVQNCARRRPSCELLP